MIRCLLLLLITGWLWAEPRLISMVQAPKGSMGVWLRGDYFGIDGQWDYNDDTTGREWCWLGTTGKAVGALARAVHVEHVEPETLSAILYEGESTYRWFPDEGGVYVREAMERQRFHGSENFRPHSVVLPGGQRRVELEYGGVKLVETSKSRRLKRIPLDAYTLALQPGRSGSVAVAAKGAVVLLDPANLEVRHKLKVAGVCDLAFDENGNRLILLTGGGVIRVYELEPSEPFEHQWDRLWRGPAPLTPATYQVLVYRYELRTGKRWWDFADIRPYAQARVFGPSQNHRETF